MLEHNIVPGIYRVILGSYCRPPGEGGLQKFKAWHEEIGREADTQRYLELRTLDIVLKEVLKSHALFLDNKKNPKSARGFTVPSYFERPVDFLTVWINGYAVGNEHEMGGILDHFAKGFELQYSSWNEDDPYFRISYQERFINPKNGEVTVSDRAWTGIDELDRMNRGIVLATDLNGIMDISGYMALAVNDLDAKRVYSYKPIEETSTKNKHRWKEKTLLAGEDPYVWADSIDEPKFPFESLNPLKTYMHTWTAIGFTPQEIFDALKKIGFKFPTDSKL